jgi:hypothetical protein
MLVMGYVGHLLVEKIAEFLGAGDRVVRSARPRFLEHLGNFVAHVGENVTFVEVFHERINRFNLCLGVNRHIRAAIRPLS